MTKLEAKLTSFSPIVVSLFRVVVGLLFLCHATSHLFGWPVAGQQAPVGNWPFWWAGLIELVVSVLLIVGLVTRLAAFVGSGVMAIAYFTQHLPKSLWPIEQGGGELAMLYCFAFFLLVFVGGGAWALDAMR